MVYNFVFSWVLVLCLCVHGFLVLFHFFFFKLGSFAFCLPVCVLMREKEGTKLVWSGGVEDLEERWGRGTDQNTSYEFSIKSI